MSIERGDSAQSSLELALSRRGIELDHVRIDESGSVVPPKWSLPAHFDQLIADLPILLGDDTSPTTHQLEIGEKLGEGGMGEVRLATQRALRRPVAVKVQHAEVRAPTATLQLLREARVTGLLEHPNIVPIHALGRDDKGRPHIVMKRIEGDAWSDTMRQRPAADSDDNLAFHLETLRDVMGAVAFAHSRGVLHLDIKPDNVMIGTFGEVYLVDWGVAVRLADDVGHPDVPVAADIEHIVGTPQYMAPELVAASGDDLSIQTDIYLLGACLHQILTGEPPHDGPNLRAVFHQAFMSIPHRYRGDWPRELTDIAHRAMHANPRQRFPTVADMAAQVTAFLHHRHGRRLAEGARERLRHLEGLIDDIGAESPSPDVRRAVHDTFSACRFGYDLALREWGDNGRAKRGLQRCLERMIQFELDHGAAKTAASYLAELPKPNTALTRTVQLGVRREEAKGQAFERLRRDADVTVGDRLRGVVAMLTGIAWGLSHLFAGRLHRDPGFDLSHWHMVGLGAAFIAASSLVAIVGRKVFFSTAANTRNSVAYITVFVGYTAVWLIAARIGIPAQWALALFLVCSSMVWTVLALSSDRRLLPLPAALISTIFAINVLPAYAFELFGVASLVGPVAVALMWLRR